jgi:RNA polymerase subunit RPABC4/transcription elongation factor Spt4
MKKKPTPGCSHMTKMNKHPHPDSQSHARGWGSIVIIVDSELVMTRTILVIVRSH